MKKLIFILLIALLTSVSISAQTAETKAKKLVFRANKDQIIMAQKMLKVPDTGKIDVETRDALKKFQTEKGIAATGAMNRSTLEKLGIGLTTVQREFPISPESAEPIKSEPKNSTAAKSIVAKSIVFRATKDQIIQAQKMLKENSFYAGAETGALDAATRVGLKKYQAANELTATGTLDQATLEKMNIELTDKQKENLSKESQ